MLGLFAEERVREMSVRDLLLGSDFQFAVGTGDGPGQATIWGRGSLSGFGSRPEAGLRMDGDVFSGLFGFDRAHDGRLAGLAVNYSDGKIDYRVDGNDESEIEAQVVSLHPYAHWWGPGHGLWVQAGYGRGDATRDPKGDAPVHTGIDLAMVAAGGHRRLDTETDIDWALKADSLYVKVRAQDLLPAVDADAWVLRLNLEGATTEALADPGETLSGNARIGLRLDEGTSDSGMGVEIGTDIEYAHPGLGIELELSGRALVAHGRDHFSDWGLGLAARFDPGEPGQGLHVTVEPAWGDVSDGTDDLWDGHARIGSDIDSQADDPDDPGEDDAGMRMDAFVGYGWGVMGKRGLLTPFADLGWSERATLLRIGTRLELALARDIDIGMEIHEELDRREGETPERDRGIFLRARLSF